jgi:hypothetical protein
MSTFPELYHSSLRCLQLNLNEVFQPNLFCIVPPFKWHSDINGFIRQSSEIVERKINQVTRTMTKNKHLKMKRSMSSCKPAISKFMMHKQENQDERTKQALSVSKFRWQEEGGTGIYGQIFRIYLMVIPRQFHKQFILTSFSSLTTSLHTLDTNMDMTRQNKHVHFHVHNIYIDSN